MIIILASVTAFKERKAVLEMLRKQHQLIGLQVKKPAATVTAYERQEIKRCWMTDVHSFKRRNRKL